MGEEQEGRVLKELRGLIGSGRPLIYLLTPEEGRVATLLQTAAETMFSSPPPVFSWSVTDGIVGPSGSAGEATREPRAALDFILDHEGPALFHLKDFHEALRESAVVRRRLRDLYAACLDRGKFVFISSALRAIPAELQRDMALVELNRPDLAELRALIDEAAVQLESRGVTTDPDPEVRKRLARSLVGLTTDEARHALRRAAAAGNIGTDSIRHLIEEKHLIVRKTGVIEYVPPQLGFDDLGGVPYLKKWLAERRKLFQMRDELSADLVPRGVLVMGVSGCGKSLAVKAVAACFDLPLYRLDMVEIFSGRHGPPESAFADACRTLEEMSPAVMWLDEIEMGISAQTDDAAGMLGRIFAHFLTWMQEKSRGLFVAATANRIDLLPAEMIRKGRFDEVFFVDLPAMGERTEIFEIHLRRRGVDPEAMQLDRLGQFTRGWTGAEIEQCVISAMTTASLAERALTGDDLLNTTAKIVPLSKTMKEQVEHIRAWALDRAVRAAPRGGDRG